MASPVKKLKYNTWLRFILTVAVIILAARGLSFFHLRIDLTEDGRYTLSAPARKILGNIRNDIFIQVYLDGDMPIPLKRLRRSVMEMLDEFRLASHRKIDYEFINPAGVKDADQREAQYNALTGKGLYPVDVQASDAEGGKTRKRIFPGMIINYNGVEVPVNFLKNDQTISSEKNIQHSIEGLEYEMIQPISTLTSDTVYKVAFLEGQGEYKEIQVADITLNLAKYFTIDRGTIGGQTGILDKYAALIVAGPEREFSEPDKLVIDQYIMNGGKVLWMLEEVAVNSDSLSYSGETVALYHPLNIEDQLFRYGARINPELIQDIDCGVLFISVSSAPGHNQILPAPWLYYPLLTPNQKHPVTRNINAVLGEFTNTLDTVGLDPAIHKTILLSTSDYSRTLSPPLVISLNETEEEPSEKDFNKKNLPVAVLLEGNFPSAFRNRIVTGLVKDRNFRLKTLSRPTRMIVVADGDIIRNEVHRAGAGEVPGTLGFDRYSGQTFGNRDFIINCMNYLVDDKGLLNLRSRQVKLRLLNKSKLMSQRLLWQVINIAGPVVIVILTAFVYGFFRKRMFTR